MAMRDQTYTKVANILRVDFLCHTAFMKKLESLQLKET